jgi:hypothetical protein
MPVQETKTNRSHKDSIFRQLFSEKDNLLELYNAVSGKNYPPETEIKMVTLSDVLFMNWRNDIAFMIEEKLVVLIEHQSTINENMPLRMLTYVSREYEQITDSEGLYRKNRINIPTPEFIVLYNGKEEIPEYVEMKLSDSFFHEDGKKSLELVVKVYNINKGKNVAMANRSPVLNGYETFVAEVNENIQNGMSHKEAVPAVVKSCIRRGILVSFLKRHGSEAENMIAAQEWKEEIAVRANHFP